MAVMGSNGSAVATVASAGIDPVVAEAIAMQARLDPLRAALNLQDLSGEEMSLFAMVALRLRLDPFARQIYAIKRKGKVTFQVGIDGFRSSAEDTGEYRGSDEPEYGPMATETFGRGPDATTYERPEWARVVVHRLHKDGTWTHQPARVEWAEFYPDNPAEGFQWRRQPKVMLAKCAEAAAFRRAFPRRFAGVYETAEMDQASAAEHATQVGPPLTHREAIAQQRAQLEAQTTSAGVAVSVAGETVEPAVHPEAPLVATAGEAAQCDWWSGTDLGEDVRCRDQAAHRGQHRSKDSQGRAVSWPQGSGHQ